MKGKSLIVLAVMLILPVFVFSAQFHSVPLGNEAYRLIDVAVVRGAVSNQSDVRPYNYNLVRSLLNEMLSSDCFSASEKSHINSVLEDLESLYGTAPTSEFTDLFKNGYLRSAAPNSTSVGGMASFDFTIGVDSTEGAEDVLDVRINGQAYIRGDLFSFMSYDLNFKLNLDRIDPRARLTTDLQINCDGFYMDFFHPGNRLTVLPIPEDAPEDEKGVFGLFLGIEAFPEISLNFKDELFTARFGTVKRSWGPGYNNLGLSGSARAFDAIELGFSPVSWFSYHVLVGSLGNVSLDSVNGVEWPSENMDAKNGKYSNNFSMHRVDLEPLNGMRFGIWESVVWRKRFEISYLNPFSIYMFAQNALGDYDNVLAGFDFSYTIPGIGRLYAALAMDELNNLKFISNPRNILSYQIGAEFSPGFLDFSLLTVQATYVPAFFGSHYQDQEPLFADVPYTTAYVNKGQNIGYPVNPDTFEILMNFKTTISEGLSLDLTVKDQMRSAQYSYKTTGTDILTYMSYDAYDYGEGGDFGEYYKRDFFQNIWNNAFNVEAVVEKKLNAFPITISFGLNCIWDMTRPFNPTVKHGYEGYDYNPGTVEFTDDWVNTVIVNMSMGARIYY